MESTHEFVKKLHEKQAKDEKNKNHQRTENPSRKLPNKQHNQGVD